MNLELLTNFIDRNKDKFCLCSYSDGEDRDILSNEDFTIRGYEIYEDFLQVYINVKTIVYTLEFTLDSITGLSETPNSFIIHLQSKSFTIYLVDPNFQYIHIYFPYQTYTDIYTDVVNFSLSLVPDIVSEFTTLIKLHYTYDNFSSVMSLPDHFMNGIRIGNIKGSYIHDFDEIQMYLFNFNDSNRYLHIVDAVLHELRHVYQLKYFSEKMNFHSSNQLTTLTGKEYNDTWVEQDAINFARDIIERNWNYIHSSLEKIKVKYDVL